MLYLPFLACTSRKGETGEGTYDLDNPLLQLLLEHTRLIISQAIVSLVEADLPGSLQLL
jgi:hypothetical protein